MPLVNRFARLLRADLNALIDRIEEPVLVAREAVREMEHELAALERRAQALVASDAALACEDRHLVAGLAVIERELDTCLAAGADALARDLVRRKLAHGRRRDMLARARDRNAAARGTLADTVARARGELATLRARLAAHADSADCAAADSVPMVAGGAPSEAEIDIALLQEKAQRAQTGRAPA